jgi:phosphatidylglycerophosphatase A
MPGTVGSAVTMLLLIPLLNVPLPVYIAVFAAVTAVGVVASDMYEKKLGRIDPGEVVIDEAAGCMASMMGLGFSYIIPAFVLFRVIDILKPFPVKPMEKLPGGIGIMADDICGGFIVNLILRATAHWYILG